MSEEVRRIMTGSPNAMATVINHNFDTSNDDYVIHEYMERLGTRLNILETELKYAWRALDLLSQEYIKMWERLEKLEGLLCEQQSVISQLLHFYTSGGNAGPFMTTGTAAILEGRLGELEVIREILGNGAVEDGLEEGLDVTGRSHNQSAIIQEIELDATSEDYVPDEAFYRSLNQAYREDLVGCDPNVPLNQLDLIWEEKEDTEESPDKKDDRADEVYSSIDYKDYRGNAVCISEEDIAQLSRIDSIDHATMEKLNELDRLSNKLQQDSVNIKQLQRKLLESPMKVDSAPQCTKSELFANDTWSFSNAAHEQKDLLMVAKSDLSNSISSLHYPRSSSRLSVTDSVAATDNEVAEVLAGELRTPTSPRRRTDLITPNSSEPFTTVTGRLAYSNAVQHVESAEAAAALQHSKNPFYCSSSELNAIKYEMISSVSPNIFKLKQDRSHSNSPTLSICSMRTRQDGYIDPEIKKDDKGSPPPPAPREIGFISQIGMELHPPSNQVFLDAYSSVQSIIGKDHDRLSPKTPHSPKSPKSSPKRYKTSSNIVAAKSDSGLSSMSGWSSLEKSPGSPKNGRGGYYHENFKYNSMDYSRTSPNKEKPYMESETDSKILPGGHHMSAFTKVKSPCSIETSDGYGTFVPAPAPASDINVSPRRKPKSQSGSGSSGEFMYRSDQPAIYSVAGSNSQTYTSVYTSNSADYISQAINYPDLLEPYNNEFHNNQKMYMYNSLTTTANTETSKKPISRTQSLNTDNISNHDAYKTAMYRTMFPTGNITDALSYYPTSSRYEIDRPTSTYNDCEAWNDAKPNTKEHQNPQNALEHERSDVEDQPIYENQQIIDQQNRLSWNQRQEIPFLDLDLGNKNLNEFMPKSESNNVIMTQSGYITISNNMTDTMTKTHKKKIKRGNTLKSAMTSVQQWLPDIHLPKRHRSYSLPGGVQRQDLEGAKETLSKNGATPRRKKKNIVSTVSGIFQKAKRKAYNQHRTQSLSDPEQSSEHEWIIKRASSLIEHESERSEDSCSLLSDITFENDNLFQRVSKPRPQPEIRNRFEQELDNERNQTFKDNNYNQNDPNRNHVVEDVENVHNEVNEPLFPTIGESKRNSLEKEESVPALNDLKMKIPACNSSMEFAVSRALGKYRQRQSSTAEESTVNGDNCEEEEPVKTCEIKTKRDLKHEIMMQQRSSESHSIESVKSADNGFVATAAEGSPSAGSIRSHRFFGRHQQSLEIPGQRGDDDDNRSTHSWRSTSRVSSRRQSTEDSIDSEDEWYCYELKKLEEMERQSQLEAEMGETLQEEPEDEVEDYAPMEEVKEKMSFVLRELRMKAKVVEGVLDEKDNNLHTIQSAKRRGSSRQSAEFDTSIFAKVKHVTQELKVEVPEEHSSGDTSGPDSPHVSTDEFEDNEYAIEQNFIRCAKEKKNKLKQELPPPSPPMAEVAANIPKIQIDDPVTPVNKEEQKEEQLKDAGPMGSKWKLLKALKERKAEEKCIQEKVVEPVPEPKVSMLEMMQKFYEIHVKT